MLLSVHLIAILERAISILNRQQKINKSLWPLPWGQREGRLEGHFSGSVFDKAPRTDTRLAASPTPRHHNIHQQMTKKKAINDESWYNVDLGWMDYRGLHKSWRENKKCWRRVHALGFALDEERRKRSPEFVFFFFLVNEHISPGARRGGGGVRGV